MKHEWKKHEKHIYLPKTRPEVIEIPSFNYLILNGTGNPNSKEFQERVGILYALSYAVRMSYKWPDPPKDYYEYTVYPLEGIWDIADKSKYVEGSVDKDNLAYDIMIRQPSFLTHELFSMVIEKVGSKKPGLLSEIPDLKEIEDSQCIQMMHLGSYDDEPITFAIMEKYADDCDLKRVSKVHREIYISDPRKTEKQKMKTVLRFKVEEKKKLKKHAIFRPVSRL